MAQVAQSDLVGANSVPPDSLNCAAERLSLEHRRRQDAGHRLLDQRRNRIVEGTRWNTDQAPLL